MLPPVCTPHFVGNHLALDFVNSLFGTGENHCDCLEDDAGTVAWLQAAGQLAPGFDRPVAGLAAMARLLREAGSRLISDGKSAEPGDLDVINRILETGRPVRRLARGDSGSASFVVTELRRDDSVASLLEPVAAAFVRLLVEGDVLQVRQCEAHDCTLRFLDVTKSGRRRWCSMAVCGNRMKVAAFRARKDAV
ncbi:MAG: CGNR zinc finger domain-containing protein [Pseudomonadota bacterium]|nr:CGNR zinc finger domain-containing protein [Pseudomonadota bacterium]